MTYTGHMKRMNGTRQTEETTEMEKWIRITSNQTYHKKEKELRWNGRNAVWRPNQMEGIKL